MKKTVTKKVYIIGAPSSGKKTMASEIANQLNLNVYLEAPKTSDQFTIFYDLPEEEMESRGAESDSISRFMQLKKRKAFMINAMADPSTVFE